MPTILQQDLAEAIVKNTKLPRDKKKNKGELLESVGYSAKVAKHKPTEILEQKGVKEALANYGLTEGLITKALVSDIKAKKRNRLGEMRLGAEILKMNDTSKSQTQLNVQIINGVEINIRKNDG